MNYISNIEKDDNELYFTINSKNKLKVGLVNGLRRILLSDIPILAISHIKINFIKNTFMFDNEYIKHRLGLVSINNNALENMDDIILVLKKKNESDDIISVYLDDFEVKQKNTVINNKDIFQYPKTLLLKLKPLQEIHIETTLHEGTGRENARFCPVSTAFYHFDYDKDERLYEKDKHDYPIKYKFTIESSGQFKCKELLLKSIDILKDKLLLIKTDIQKKSGNVTSFKYIPESNNVDLYIVNENDTVGNLITQYIIDEVPDIRNCGYHIPHPLNKILIIRMSYGDNEIDTLIDLLSNTINNIVKLLDELIKDVTLI